MTDGVSLIQRNLEALKSLEENISSRNNEGTIADIIKNIHDVYINFNLKVQERESANAHLLSKDTGILSSLRALLSCKDVFRNVKLECFKLLDDIIDLSSKHVQEYGSDIQSVCILYIKHDVGALVKKASIITLSKLLEACRGFQGEKRIKPQTLIDVLFFQLCLKSKLPITVKEEILCLIGLIAHYYPEDFILYQERVFSMYLQELKTEVKVKSPNYNTIAGCLQGLKEYMYNFPVLCSEDQENSYFIFDIAKKMAIESEKFFNKSTTSKASGTTSKASTTTSSACKAGLQMLAAHAHQFSQFIFEDCINLFVKLKEWVSVSNRDMQKLGRDAVIAVLKVTSEMCMNEFMDKQKYCRNVFKFFIESFRDIFLGNTSNSKELHIAVVGYGLFAGPCKLCMPESKVKNMFQNIIQKSEYEFFSENRNLNDSIMILPCYIESIASIMSNIDFIPENMLFSVEKLVIFQIDKFPKMPTAYNFIVPKSIIHVLVALQPKGEIFGEFLSEIVYQGLVKTCSHPVVVDAESIKDRINKEENESSDNSYLKESNVKIVTYKDYMYLWKTLLNVIQIKELSALNVPVQDRQYIMECTYDQIIRSSLDLISKLDLSVQSQTKQDLMDEEASDEDTDISSDPLHGIQANNRTDVYIFLNIVDFLRDLLTENCTELFYKWVYIHGREMISYSTLHPYHSGFYKLISLNLSICNKINYFKDIPTTQKRYQVLNKVENVVWASFHLFSKFVKEIVVKLQQFKDELLSSCLQVLLVLPTEMVLREISLLIPALETALKLGMSYLPLATNAICALETWSDSIPLEELKPHFPSLLPYLNSYILASGSHDTCSIPLVKETKAPKKVHKMSTKLVKKRTSTLDMVEDSELQKIQLRIIKFLGRLGEHNSALLQNAFQNVDKVAIAWDSMYRNHLKYEIPFVDMKPEIYFDDFLPRVLEVATKSSVRQVKVAACETLHSLVLFMIGKGSTMTDALREKLSMESLYRNIFPGLLELACDVEQVAKQLFTPLVLQIIHWFTHSKVIKTLESSMILLSLWDGVTHKENASLRDFSALCLREYFQWSLKQAPERAEKYRILKSLLNKLASFSLHPSPYKRKGAALTFNNIYRIFRTEEDFVKEYTVQLLIQFIDSLAIAHTDDKSLGTQKQCLAALEHVEKIIIVKHKYFLEPYPKAKLPGCLEDSSLKSVVLWLLLQCGSIQTECRHKCMDLVVKLSPLVPGVKDPASFVLDYNVGGNNIFEDIFEKALRSNKSGFSGLTSFQALSFWLEALLASLECYHWSFSSSLMLQTILVGNEHAHLLSAVQIFTIMKHFITNIVKEPLSAVMHRSNQSSTNDIFTPEEELKYNRLKCSVLVRFMSFIASVFKESANWFHIEFFRVLWNQDLWEVLMVCTVNASSIGFDMNDPEVFANLPKEISSLLNNCLCQKKDFQEYCYQFLIQEKYNLSKLLPVSLKEAKEDPLRLIQIFIGYEQLISCGLWSPEKSSDVTGDELIDKLLSSVASISAVKDQTSNQKTTSNPVAITVANKMLSVAYSLGLKVDDLAVRLLNKNDCPGSMFSKPSQPLVFNNFIESLCEFACKNPQLFIQTLVDNSSEASFTAISVLLKFVDHVAHTKTLRRNYGKAVIEGFLSCWTEIYSWLSNHSDADSIYSVLTIMLKLLLIDSEVALNPSRTFSSSLYSTYVTLLRREGATFEFIVQAFNILPFFLEHDKADLSDCLEEIIATHFPLLSTELKPGTTAYHTYISALKKLLTTLSLTGNGFLLEILTTLVCKESAHIMEDNFKKSVIQMVEKAGQTKQEKFCDAIFGIILKEKCVLKSEILLSILEKVLVLMLQRCGLPSFINFYLKHIKTIMAFIKGATKSSDESMKIVKKIYGFKLVETLYGKLPKNLIHTKESQIVETYLGHAPNAGNELTGEITKMCLEFRRINFESEPVYKELHRKLNCASYNALIAVVSCTQNDLKFYNAFLFKENPMKNERIWERLIDKDMCLKFDMELEAPLNRQKKFITIRHQMRSTSEMQDNKSDSDSSQVESSLQLLGSENLGLSSLAEDASKFVFSTEDQIYTPDKEMQSIDDKGKSFSYGKKQFDAKETIELDDDDLNNHECMASLTCLIKYMKSLGLIPDETADTAPPWINFFASSLEDSSSHVNTKLFIGRLIVNNATILQPYAKFLLKPLIKLIVSGTAGTDLNYYILDVIITLLSWAPTAVPEENLSYETCELLRFLIKHCDHPRREIFRNNMEVVKTVLECWKDVLEIPYDEIYQKMNNSEADSKKNLSGIQLLGVVIFCGFAPYDYREETRGLSYLNVLLRNLNHKYKEIHGSAAEVVSLVLKKIGEREEDIEKHPFFSKVINYLENLKQAPETVSNFLYCLNKIHYGCPKIADRFISKILFIYPSVHGVYKNHILEVLCSRVECIPSAFKELKSIGLFEDMEKKTEPLQFLSLQALEKLVPSLSCDDLLNILPDIVEIHTQPSAQCRLALYKILFVLYETYINNDGAKEKEVTRYAQETLISGLADPDESVRLTVDNFWSNERLPSGTKERLIAVLKNLYSPSTEESFLQYATFLLLERTSKSPDYKRKIFDHPLTECNFQTYQIQVSWRKRHMAMSSVFTETVSSSLGSSLMMGESFDVSKSFAGDRNLVKATQQNYDFPETLDPSNIAKGDTYNWLTEKTMDTYAPLGSLSGDSFLGSFGGSLSKSHLIGLKSSSRPSVKDVHSVSDLKKKEDKKTEKSSVWMLKRRFMKDKGDSELFAKQELRRQDRRMEISKEQQSRREAQVFMYRQYRIGELPDIEISNSAIIAPIQALAMNDVVIARLLFKSLVVSVCNYVKQDFPEEYDALISEISNCFGKILNTSYVRTPSVISFCLESINLLQDINFDAEHVFAASMGSNQQSIGILLLESKILKGFDFQPSVKKRRSDRQSISEERNFWMKLAELYRSLNDYDVVNGIFSLTMGQRQENKKALQYECSGFYFDACNLYSKLYEEASDDICDQAEKDFWDKSLLSCLDNLTKWEDLETIVSDRFLDSVDHKTILQLIQEDQYVKDIYLPYWVRSKTKLLLGGKNEQALLDFFDGAKKDEENKIYLENFSEELSLLYILQDKFDIARQFSSNCLHKFLKDWQILSPLAVKMQESNLQKLLKYIELDEFLCLMKNDKFLDLASTSMILKNWQKRYPSLTDTINIWDDMCCNRQLYLKKLQEKIENKVENFVSRHNLSSQDSLELADSPDEQLDFKNIALRTLALTKIQFAENAAEQKNFPVAIKNLKEIHKVSRSLEQEIWSRFIQCYCIVNNKRCHSLPKEKLDILLQSLKQLSNLEIKCGISISAKRLQSQTLELIAEMFIKGEATVTSENRELIVNLCGSSDQTVSSLLNKSFSCLKEVIDLEKSNDHSTKNPASAQMALANFCNKYLRKDDDSDFSPRNMQSYDKFPVLLVESLLTALENGIDEAFLLFPRLLQIIELHPSSLLVFKEKASKMPCWLFINWINQMLALLDKPEASAVQDIIENITVSYPDAIIYAFHLSYENYDFPDSTEGKINKAFVEKMKSILHKQTLVTDFVAALEHLKVPAVIFRDYFMDIVNLINSKASHQEIVSSFKAMLNSLFNIDEKDKTRRMPIGPMQRQFAEEFKERVLNACGENGNKLISGNPAEQNGAIKKFKDVVGNAVDKAKKDVGLKNLETFSPWLRNFQPWKYSSQIEIPGQYTGRSKPLPEYHVKVSGFEEKVMVLHSIALPRRITIRGNDQKEYKILVKTGEDLRQDARIQQMFSAMNEIFQNDVACSQRHLTLKTYKVIPLSNRLGLIEWLDNTTVLQSFMLDGLTERDRQRFIKGNGESNAARDRFLSWELKFFQQNNMVFYPLYKKLYQEKSREECVKKYQEIVDVVPKNLLTKTFLKLSSSPEAFVALRTRFATSHAVICISQWILGIGDRHLCNFLVDKTSGYEIGIDFGHAFGSATQFLQIPELVPFRLTPQYLQLLDPLKMKGTYEATMVHALTALQNKKELLLNMMDIFIKEPTLDWKVHARKQEIEWGENFTGDDWFPKQRISLARKKLEGFNPCRITREELELGHRSKECFEFMESVCLGNHEHNVRARYHLSGLSPEEQVDCLIDQATDPHLLCLTYIGWSSYM